MEQETQRFDGIFSWFKLEAGSRQLSAIKQASRDTGNESCKRLEETATMISHTARPQARCQSGVEIVYFSLRDIPKIKPAKLKIKTTQVQW